MSTLREDCRQLVEALVKIADDDLDEDQATASTTTALEAFANQLLERARTTAGAIADDAALLGPVEA